MQNKIIKYTKKTLLWTLTPVLILVVFVALFINLHPTFGDGPNAESLTKISRSKHYHDGHFHNLVKTDLMTESDEESHSIMDYFFPPEDKNPGKPLPSKKLENATIKNGTYTWLGHASILMKTNDLIILTDPVFNRATPLPFGGKPFPIEHPIYIEHLPKVDVVLISHDHYDHLDYKGIKNFAQSVDMFFVPLGVKAHIMKWGVSEDKIVEMDWYENSRYKNTEFTLVPARHFSGRGITDQSSTLWGGWVIKSDSQNVYFSGDSGYFKEFQKIGEKYGPFDIAFIDTGAYNQAWAKVHMMPEESVQASIDLNANVYFPIGWSKFDLAPHMWDDPIIRAVKEATKKNVIIATPLIGETFSIGQLPQEQWWQGLRE